MSKNISAINELIENLQEYIEVILDIYEEEHEANTEE
jgi:hypothetical protein